MSVDATGLSVSYGSHQVLHDVTIAVASSEWLGLIGPNGAGKSTLLKAFAGLVTGRGTVHLDGRPIDAIGRRALARSLAYVPQEPIMPPGMIVVDYVLLGRTPHVPYLGTEGKDDVLAALRALESLELEAFAHRPVDDLSGGERQRVVLARALAQDPSILLLDEPTSALDIGHQQQALELIGAIRDQRALTVVTAMHDLTLAGQFADRLALIADGHLVADGAVSDVLTATNIQSHYDASVEIIGLPDGGIAVVPIRGVRP